MVNKTTIGRILRQLDSRYKKKSRNPRDPLYFSKLALIELCGWIEVTMDGVVLDCAKRHLSDTGNLKYVGDQVIRRTTSFTYEDHFRTMLMRVVGLVKIEKLEKLLDQQKWETMKSSLKWLKEKRDQQAHTYITDVTTTIDAPSVITSHFETVYRGLKDVEMCVRRLDI